MDNDNKLCDKCGLRPQQKAQPKPCACKPKKCCKKKDCCNDNEFAFRKVVIPASLGDDVTGQDLPSNGAYTNSYVVYEANGAQYMYDSFGVYTKIEGNGGGSGTTDFNELTNRPRYAGSLMTSDTNIPEVKPQTIFYVNSQETGATRHIYKDDHFTEEASVQDLLDANEKGPMAIRITIYPNTDGVFSDAYIQNTYVGENDYQFVFLDEKTYREYAASTTADTTFYYFSNVLQTQLSAGNNIQINSNVISATDTTYNNFTGTDGVDPGTAGLVPAPATTDAGKFLKADGTWDTAGGSSVTVVQTTGTSQTDVMSQVATSQLVYPSGDETAQKNIFIKGGGQGTNNYTCVGPVQVSGYVNTTQGSTAIGGGAEATGTRSIAIAGSRNRRAATGIEAIALDGNATANYAIAIGGDSSASLQNAIAIGHNSVASNAQSIAIGYGASATSNPDTVAIGENSKAWGAGSVVIGHNIIAPTSTGGNGCVVIGHGSAANTQYTTRDNEFCVHASTTANQPMVHSNVDTPTLGTDAANKNYVDGFYSVGTVYASTSATAPTFAGGTWTEIGTQTIGSSTVHYYERTA